VPAAVARVHSTRTIRADLGGNGRLERARVVMVKGAPSQCRWFVVVTSGTKTASTPLPRTLVGLGRPGLFGVVRLGADSRREIVVRSNVDAKNEAFAVYAFERGTIRRVRVAARGSRDLLFAGAGGALIAVGCLDRGGRHVVASDAVSGGGSVRVDRHFFKLAQDRLVQTSSQKLMHANLNRLPEFRAAQKHGIRGLAFAGCDLRVPAK
jgi:hypothetical protein